MSTTGLKSNTGAASHGHRNFYGFRITNGPEAGALVPLARPFGSITAAWAWAHREGADLDALETVDLRRDVEAREILRALGCKGLPR